MNVEDGEEMRPGVGREEFVGDLFEGITPECPPVGLGTRIGAGPLLAESIGDTPAPRGSEHRAPVPDQASPRRATSTKRRTSTRPDPIDGERMVRDAFDEAKRAASAAFDTKVATTLGADGRIRDLCGFAYVIAYEVSPWLRAVLKRQGEAKTNGKGEWRFPNLGHVSTGHGIQANSAAADAACNVLRSRLGDHASFYMESGLD